MARPFASSLTGRSSPCATDKPSLWPGVRTSQSIRLALPDVLTTGTPGSEIAIDRKREEQQMVIFE
jgi:hypothetical protein